MVNMPSWVTSPDPAVVERVTLLNMLGYTVDDPNVSTAELRDRTAFGSDVENAQRIGGFTYDKWVQLQTDLAGIKTKYFISAKDFALVGDGIADDSAAFAQLLTAGAGKVILLEPWKTYKLAGTFTVADNTTIMCTGGYATVKQTTANTLLFSVGNNFSSWRVEYVGVGTDYVANTTLAANCFDANGKTNIFVEKCRFKYFAGSGVRLTNTSNITIQNNYFEGTDAVYHNITAVDSQQFGVYVNGGVSNILVRENEFCQMVTAYISSIDTVNQHIIDNYVHDIKGQHGFYIQNGDDLVIMGNRFKSIALNAFKLQLNNSVTDDSTNVFVIANKGDLVGDTLCSVNNISISGTDAAFVYKIKNLFIDGLFNTNGSRTLYLENIRGGSAQHVYGFNNTSDDITYTDVQDFTIDHFQSINSGRNGFRAVTKAGCVNSGLRFSNGLIKNPGQAAVAGQKYGMFFADSALTDAAVDNTHIESTDGKMDHGLYFQAGNQAGLKLHRVTAKGSNTNQDIRLKSATEGLGLWDDVTVGTTVLNFPLGLPVQVGGNSWANTFTCNAAPTMGFYLRGAICWHNTPAVGTIRGWINTNQGGSYSGSWAATTAYTVGQWMRTSAGRVIECTVAGTSGTVEPAPTVLGQVVTDGTVTWVCRGTSLAVWTSMGVL